MSRVDPRLFPRRVRYAALFTINVYVFMGNMYGSGITTGFESLAKDLHAPNSKLASLVSYSVLAMGLANIFWMPLALCFGKRPTVLASMAMFLGGCIWSVVAKDFNSLLGARVFASFGYGAIESLAPSILADIFFERHYSTAMAVYAGALSGGSQIGPVIAGYLIQSRGWRWFFILCSIIAGANFLSTIFLLPETIYEPESETDLVEEPEKGSESFVEAVRTQSQSGNRAKMNYREYWRELFVFKLPKEPQEKGIFKHFAYLLVLPFPMLLVPGVLIASITYGVCLGSVVAISTIAPDIFMPPPYLFTSADLGLFSVSSFIGILVSWPIAGPLTDLFSRWMRKYNNGVHKPEHRLPALAIPFLICPVGLIVFGYTVSQKQNYVRPAVGSAISSAGLTLIPSVMLSYVVDSYPKTSGEALVLVNTSKNVVAFGLSEGAYSWMAMEGIAKMFYEFAGIEWAVLALALPLYFAGPWLRNRTSNLL